MLPSGLHSLLSPGVLPTYSKKKSLQLKSDALSSLQKPVPPASPLLLVRPSIDVQSKGDSGGGGDGGAGDADEHGGVVQMSMAATQPAARRDSVFTAAR